MHCNFVAEPRLVGSHTPEKERAFQDADTTFKGGIISVLGDSIVDAYVTLQTGKEIWDALEAKYGVSDDAASDLYVMEQFHNYRMVDDSFVVEQAHEIQTLAKENSRILVQCCRISLLQAVLLLSYHMLGQTLLLL
jgi:transcription elongation factor GreA-like protein